MEEESTDIVAVPPLKRLALRALVKAVEHQVKKNALVLMFSHTF